jgi:ParB family chromosome partitioning protein
MAQKNVLGKGLGAIFPDLINDTDRKKIFSCSIEELRPNRYQPRKNFDDEQQKQLIASIQHNGIIQPIVVRKLDKGYEIIAGERRWRAAQAAGLREVPVVIRDATEMQAAELSLIENIQREELNPLEEAHAYTTLMETFKLSQEAISSRVGKDRSTIANTIRLLKLPEKAKAALVEKKISSGHARCILACSSEEEQLVLLERIIKKNLNVRETENILKKLKKPSSQVKTPAKKDRFLKDLEGSLSEKLMAKVVISGSSMKGCIEIHYKSLDELNRLTGLILDDVG